MGGAGRPDDEILEQVLADAHLGGDRTDPRLDVDPDPLLAECSLQLFERGVQLSRFCHTRLEDAERRIEILSQNGEREAAPDTLTPSLEDGSEA